MPSLSLTIGKARGGPCRAGALCLVTWPFCFCSVVSSILLRHKGQGRIIRVFHPPTSPWLWQASGYLFVCAQRRMGWSSIRCGASSAHGMVANLHPIVATRYAYYGPNLARSTPNDCIGAVDVSQFARCCVPGNLSAISARRESRTSAFIVGYSLQSIVPDWDS